MAHPELTERADAPRAGGDRGDLGVADRVPTPADHAVHHPKPAQTDAIPQKD
jgi:hypothetical protein